ncbi:MAG: DUF983 domain-containing protein [Crocinitomicaceae bacterium TMED114]|nr:MAG: DUF983 domain-containing protein [Crocinitomicaceae bacterium TMED114]
MQRPRPLLANVLVNRCPACREGRLFQVRNPYRPRTINAMHAACPACQADFEREPGFYFGAAYVSYALTVALWVAVLVALYTFGALGWITFTGFFDQPEVFLISGIVTLVLLLPPLQRLSRSIWIHMFLRYGDRGGTSEEGKA